MHLPAVLDGFDKTQATVSTIILRHAYRSISSRSESQKNGRGDKLDTIQEHKAALMLYGYNKIVATLKNVMSPSFLLR
jgi:hypothetical protein